MLVGNFFGDSFKGRPEKHGPLGVVEGIRLHREIDRYTDSHPLVLDTVKLFREQQGRFAPVVVDLVYDHLLAVDFNRWLSKGLEPFTTSVFKRLDENEEHIPQLAQRFYPHLRKHNWLLHYKKMAGLKLALEGMDRRISAESSMASCIDLVSTHKVELDQIFSVFFQDLIDHVNAHLETIESEIGSSRVALK